MNARPTLHPIGRTRPARSLWAAPLALLEGLATAGLTLLVMADTLGGWIEARVAARIEARRLSIPASSRISPSVAAVLGGVAALLGLFVWGATAAQSGADQWMTAPGAGSAEEAAQSPAAAAPAAAPAAASAAASPAGATAATSSLVVHESLVVLSDAMVDHHTWPEFVGSARIELPKDATIVLSIYNFDDGATPLAKGLPYDKVTGTVGGTVTVGTATLTSVPNAQLAHTFTVPGIGLNIPIPVAPSEKKGQPIEPVVVTATFKTTKSGTFTWQCYAPCGSGANGQAGSMAMPGYMTGKVVVS